MEIVINSRRNFYGFPEKDRAGIISHRYLKRDDLLTVPVPFLSEKPYSRSFGSETSTGVDNYIFITKKTDELKGGVLIQCLKAHYCAFFCLGEGHFFN